MRLVPCTQIWGGVEIGATCLNLDEASDIVYVPQNALTPYGEDPNWGIYSYASGDLIDAAALRCGSDGALVGQRSTANFDHEEIQVASDETYIYGGVFNPHYGHFICTTLSRLWYRIEPFCINAKVLLHSQWNVEAMLSFPFVRTCFERIGLNQDNIITFNTRQRVKRLFIPQPAFQEQSVAHSKFRDLCLYIGKPFVSHDDEHRGPAYLSKSKLIAGVGHFTNETVLEGTLKAEGFEIIYPEQLTFEEQVGLFSQKRVIAGAAGSAFHTSIFTPARSRMIALAGYDLVNSNLILIDRLTGADVTYLHPDVPSRIESNVGNFLTSMTFDNPIAIAHDLADWGHDRSKAVRSTIHTLSATSSCAISKEPKLSAVSQSDLADDKLHFATRNTLKTQIRVYGWSIGAHTYGTPLVMDEPYGQLTIGKFCSISMNVTIALSNHRIDTVSSYPFLALAGLWPGAETAAADHENRGGVIIGNDVWIGVGAVILAGSKIGTGCVIGANAVIRGDIPDYAVVVGNPGRIIRKRFDEGTITRLLATKWWDWDEATLTDMMPWLASGDPQLFIREVERRCSG